MAIGHHPRGFDGFACYYAAAFRPEGRGGADGSLKMVYAALAGNVLVVASQDAAALSRSSARLTEAICSIAICTNQLLLPFGNRRSHRSPDYRHHFGYRGEITSRPSWWRSLYFSQAALR